jgi:predicted glycoside hydrolase/deacetylase ChbG (UPF0249 family)
MVAPEMRQPVYLIVNADDFGYFPGVSRGIIQAHREGVVTATGVLANSPYLDDDVGALLAQRRLDTGVHLNLTHGRALSDRMRNLLPGGRGEFSGKGWLARRFMTGGICFEDVAHEWRAQIERCLEHGLTLRFLNSHEHIHMLPPLFVLIQNLAADYGIPYIRFPDTGIPRHGAAADTVRCVTLRGLALLNRRRLVMPAPRFLGAESSGKLSRASLSRMLPGLQAARVYELMCHPGYGEDTDGAGRQLRQYHRWDEELECLTSEATRALFSENNVRLVGYRDLEGLAAAV